MAHANIGLMQSLERYETPGPYLAALHRQHAHSAIAQRKSQALLWAGDVSGIWRWMPSAFLYPATLCMAVFTCQAHNSCTAVFTCQTHNSCTAVFTCQTHNSCTAVFTCQAHNS